MTITFFRYIVNCTKIEKNLAGHIEEKIDLILHPEWFYYPPEYPNGFPKNYL